MENPLLSEMLLKMFCLLRVEQWTEEACGYFFLKQNDFSSRKEMF